MDGQVTAGTLVCAIPKRPMGDWLMKRFAELGQQVTVHGLEIGLSQN